MVSLDSNGDPVSPSIENCRCPLVCSAEESNVFLSVKASAYSGVCLLKCVAAALRCMLNLLILHEQSFTSNSQQIRCVMSEWIISKPVSHTSKATSRLERYSVSEASDKLVQASKT